MGDIQSSILSFRTMRTATVILIFGGQALGLFFYGCSSDTNNTVVTPLDASSNDGTVGVDSSTADSATNDASDAADASQAQIAQVVTQHALFADTPEGGAPNVDPNLVNPWGLAFSPSGVAWVADNATGVLTLYAPASAQPNALVVTVPSPDADAGAGAPSGQIFNGSTDFMGDKFIASTEDGTIAGWQAGTSATLRADSSAAGALFKGLAIVPSAPQLLLAADFHNGKVAVFDAMYQPVMPTAGQWSDPGVPAGYAPFNIAVFGNEVFVTYALQDAQQHDDESGAGHGALSVFDTTGHLVKSLVAVGGALNSPWGMAQVGAGGWGSLPAGTLLVGNFGDGAIHAFDPASGALIGQLRAGGAALAIDGLWSLVFGANAADAGVSPQQLYFTAGPNKEANGLFGYLTPQ